MPRLATAGVLFLGDGGYPGNQRHPLELKLNEWLRNATPSSGTGSGKGDPNGRGPGCIGVDILLTVS